MKRAAYFCDMTGRAQFAVRAGFTDYDTYGEGFCFAATGSIDAPKYIPQGSVRVWNTLRHAPGLSHANRDALAGCKAVGDGHDGPEAVPPLLYLHTEDRDAR